MKTLLSRSTTISAKKMAPAALIVTTLSMPAMANDADLETLIKAAQKEGAVYSVGMPDSWANWKDTWVDLKSNYGLKHQDTDMSSAQEIAKFEAEKKNATADIGDVGFAFARVAVKKGVTQPYKPTTWSDIPDWAKDKEGHWALAYTGTISFIANNNLVKDAPKSWDDLLQGDYKVTVGDVGVAAQANNAILAAAFANGGDESNLKPAIKYFAQLAKQGRLSFADANMANLEKGEIEVAIMWDFNALSYRDQIDRQRFTVNIPQDGSVISGYTTIINKYAKNPNAAKLAREYIFSDQGQINLAEGYARPIRSSITLPESVQAKLIANDQYNNVHPVTDFSAWEKSARKLPRQWQENVLIHQQ
ncbi:ABC transporter substrate-binding protein [Vibrio europaeus]|uniref:ABC transporter substrate-binding protein n=1 Tax=Vibrio europaeus TaxID=300876 RepID=A0A178JGL9_9VIBR|nr:ABC transporter substrate-binding protein [Vibrio europaeus]MDC5706780.1 ABC transporter substrate-binding protein [Vibrio europaeus]MDC5712145.1 ABC transporter substrate-binding protein [Vibrio europaeus]MDC5716788.1 ABC transporter substrate-binding protein [Vibrio europaeus]MDC5721678.1 ABC transporter substrate-binding protein [Vibrio europaeus]MDC5726087.1 ABC transporter substrate-binding protein [Vibrio europaeus]